MKRRIIWLSIGVFTAAIVFLILVSQSSLFTDQDSRAKDMIYIPAGSFILGNDRETLNKIIKAVGEKEYDRLIRESNLGDFLEDPVTNELPKQRIYLEPFYIDKHEVTNEQYKRFADSTGVEKEKLPAHWIKGDYPPGQAHHPVINITWYQARAYAQWIGKRLPSEEEWEKAARGDDERQYPWGDKYRKRLVHNWGARMKRPVEVGSYQAGRSPYGVLNMAGNAMEWTSSTYQPYPDNNFTSRGFNKTKVVRGGSWLDDPWQCRVSMRRAAAPHIISNAIGFRCALSASAAGLMVKIKGLLSRYLP